MRCHTFWYRCQRSSKNCRLEDAWSHLCGECSRSVLWHGPSVKRSALLELKDNVQNCPVWKLAEPLFPVLKVNRQLWFAWFLLCPFIRVVRLLNDRLPTLFCIQCSSILSMWTKPCMQGVSWIHLSFHAVKLVFEPWYYFFALGSLVGSILLALVAEASCVSSGPQMRSRGRSDFL